MKITIIYDNTTTDPRYKADWGFSCLVEVFDKKILFDTGTNSEILIQNMEKLKINPSLINEVFISHNDYDHVGGLSTFLKINNNVKIYTPKLLRRIHNAREVIYVKKALKIHENIYTTGLLGSFFKLEQSLVIKTEKGVVIIVGCSHPGVKNILEAASQIGKPYAIIGGLHGFKKFDLLANLKIICATHCTQYISKIKFLYPEKFIEGGVGKVIEI